MKLNNPRRKFLMIKIILEYMSCLMILLLLFNQGCGGKSNRQGIATEAAVPVEVARADKQTISESKTYSGTLEGVEQAAIVSKIAERIIDIKVHVNSPVQKGKVLIKLDSAGASSNFMQTRANFENANKNFARMKTLYEAGAISKQLLDQAETAYEVSKANFDASKSTVYLESPIDGIVSDLGVNVGDWVTPGMQLAIIANVHQMFVKFYVTEGEVAKINLSDMVKIYSEFNKERALTGRITEISRTASSEARSFQVKAKFDNTGDNWYKPGMFVNVDITLASRKNVTVVPTAAVIFENDKNVVYRIVDNKAFAVNVQIGLSNENVTEITSGLNEGDTIVIAGMNNLSDSTEVTVIK
jgi:RND family efflux transporter MFP subunit